VTISKPFYMGITNVTVDQFAAFVKKLFHRLDTCLGKAILVSAALFPVIGLIGLVTNLSRTCFGFREDLVCLT